MCLILLSYRACPEFPLVLAANRDEIRTRATAPATFWNTAPPILAGKDLCSGGTWLGITVTGRIAALSNFYDPGTAMKGTPSRGGLVTKFLLGEMSPEEYLAELRRQGGNYNGFSLLFGDTKQLRYYSNRGDTTAAVPPGVHGLSNHLLDTPWPKVVRGRRSLEQILSEGYEPQPERLFSLLRQGTAEPVFPGEEEPGPAAEGFQSRLFITGEEYCTRSSTIVLIDRHHGVTFQERTYNGDPDHDSTVRFRFRIDRGEGT